MNASSLPVKIAMLVVLCGALLLPVASIMGLIDERADLQKEVVNTVSASSSGPQKVVGPVLAIPYEIKRRVLNKDKKWEEQTEQAVQYVLPEKLDVQSRLKVDPRRIGIYQAQTYFGPLTLSGQFNLAAQPALFEPNVKIGQPYLSVSIGDTRGIRNIKPLHLNNVAFNFQPGTQIAVFESGIHAPVKLGDLKQPQMLDFSFELELQGTNSIDVVPVGASTHYALSSNWPHPSFGGDFLPTTRTVNAQGFTAEWQSTWFANNMNTRMNKVLDSSDGAGVGSLPTFSTGLIQTVDQYQLNQRSVKYAVLFIGLTFVAFFLFEVLKGLRVHPVQYALVGIALCLFYLLLLALSEHIGFNLAYLAAASACVVLITFYASHVLHSIKRALGFGAMLALLYGALWGLLQSEDNALLLGSGLLFAVLALIMIVTRKLDWYKLGRPSREPDDSLPPDEAAPPLHLE